MVVETKGREELDVPQKMARLAQWCADVNQAQKQVVYDYVFVDEEGFTNYRPDSFEKLMEGFRQYRQG